MTNLERTTSVVVGVIIGLSIVFAVVSFVYWIVAWSFDLTFEWKYSVGVSIVWILLMKLFRGGKK